MLFLLSKGLQINGESTTFAALCDRSCLPSTVRVRKTTLPEPSAIVISEKRHNPSDWMTFTAFLRITCVIALARGSTMSGMEAADSDSCDAIATPGSEAADPVDGATCNAGCICTALTTGFTNPTGSPVFQSNMKLFADSKSHNLIDSICLALDNPGELAKKAFNKAMGAGGEGGESARFRFAEDRSAIVLSGGEAAGTGLLGDKHECLDLCFRLSAYMQEHYDGLHCTLFKVLPATNEKDPYGIPGYDFEIAPAKFRFRSVQLLPPFWQRLGLKPEHMPEMLKSAKYYQDPRGLQKSIPARDIAQDILIPALV